jgi:hypothetical protein
MLPLSYGKAGEVSIISNTATFSPQISVALERNVISFCLHRSRKDDGASSHLEKYLRYSHEERADEPVTGDHKNMCVLFQIFSRQLLRESRKSRRKERTSGKESEEEKKK